MTITDHRVLERRFHPTEFREVPGSNGRQRWATAVTYNRADDYGTIWLPGVFNDGLDARMPTILYGHDWYDLGHVLGQGVDFTDTPTGVDVLIEFADPSIVPNAGLAMALVSGPRPILRDVSVGFDRQEWLNKEQLTPDQLAQGGEEAMVRAVMDELSIVVRGAVPGASLRGKRSWVIDGRVSQSPPEPEVEPAPEPEDRTVPVDELVALARRVNAGEISLPDARVTVSLMTAMPTMPADAPAEDGDEQVGSLAGALDATLDEALGCCEGVDITAWPAEAQQMAALVQAAETVVDELLDVLGVADPDDTDGAESGQAAAPEGEQRSDPEPEPLDPVEDPEPEPDIAALEALVSRTALRSR